MKKIIIIIPAYNEAESISGILDRIPKEILGYKVQTLVVNDGSTDKTKAIAENSGAMVVSHLVNQGVGKAFQTGIEHALELCADVVVNIDGDGQFSPEEIEALVTPIIKGETEFVVADRFVGDNNKIVRPKNMPKVKFVGNLLMARLISFLVGQKFNDVSCGFRAYSRKVLLMLNLTGKFTYTQESFLDLLSKGIQVKTIPVTVKYFKERKSRVANNIFDYFIRTSKIIIITFRDYKPLKFFFYLSLLPFVLSLVSGLFLLVYYLSTGSFTPYKVVGFLFIYFSAFTFALWILGFIADMFTRIRLNQEKILFYEKLNFLERKKFENKLND